MRVEREEHKKKVGKRRVEERPALHHGGNPSHKGSNYNLCQKGRGKAGTVSSSWQLLPQEMWPDSLSLSIREHFIGTNLNDMLDHGRQEPLDHLEAFQRCEPFRIYLE